MSYGNNSSHGNETLMNLTKEVYSNKKTKKSKKDNSFSKIKDFLKKKSSKQE